MKIATFILACLIVLLASSCTTIPARFTNDAQLSPNGGYVVEAEDSGGLYLEVFYKSYSFFPDPDDNIQEAKSYFVTVAQELARQRGKAIEPIIRSQLKTNATRNIIDAFYSIYVSGRVNYFTTPRKDTRAGQPQ